MSKIRKENEEGVDSSGKSVNPWIVHIFLLQSLHHSKFIPSPFRSRMDLFGPNPLPFGKYLGSSFFPRPLVSRSG